MARGFANMTPEQLQKVSRKGGRNAHKAGTAHEWTRREAQLAGQKGGRSTQGRAKAKAEDEAQRASETYES